MESEPLIGYREATTEPPSTPTNISYKSIIVWFCRQILCQRKNIYAFVTLLIPIFYLLCYFLIGLNEVKHIHFNDLNQTIWETETQAIYLVYSENCKIRNLGPYNYEIMRHFNATVLKPCKPYPPLTQVHYDDSTQRYVLSIDPTAFSSYNIAHAFGCCYKTVERISDDDVEFTECQPFSDQTQLSNTTDSIIVSCQTDSDRIYVNGHPTIPERDAVRQRLEHWAKDDQVRQVPSVLMIGIDSVSRLNLLRAMPKTAQYLYDNDWFELVGYNKVDDNTFPNLMALLLGYKSLPATDECNSRVAGGLDKCNFIWKLFQKHGYVTAYGEDAVKINTFNYLKKGFQQPPVDYYLRPYLYVAEKQLGGNVKHGLPQCVGFEMEAITVYKYAQEFAKRFLNDSFFGFFWTNTHSHDTISQTSSMDEYLRGYMQRLVAQGTMDKSIVIFFSDHGLRFGPTRSSWSGYYEERLPFVFIWLPEFIRKSYPEFVDALERNRNRLTTPYDLHLTLKHILLLTGRVSLQDNLGGAKDCPQCQSLFMPVSMYRSCEEVAIEDHWCMCRTFQPTSGRILKRLAQYIVHHINHQLAFGENGSYLKHCVPLQLHEIIKAYKANENTFDHSFISVYMLIITTLPNHAKYEATLRYDKLQPKHKKILVTGSVSRINSYKGDISCLGSDPMIKYCYCRSRNKTKINSDIHFI